MSGRLSEKVCVVTGTGGSMGHATALTFAREGGSVVGCDVAVEPAEDTVELVRGAGGQIVSLQPCHLDDPADCAKLVDLAIQTFGKIDVLFNLAGKSHFGRLENVTDEDWDAARRDEVDLIFYLKAGRREGSLRTGSLVARCATGRYCDASAGRRTWRTSRCFWPPTTART